MDTKLVLAELDILAKRLANLRDAIAENQPPTPTNAQQRVNANLCTYCGLPLGKQKVDRGAHNKCYRKAMRHIERGWTTDAKLVADGLLLPQAKQGRKVATNDPVLQTLKANAEQSAKAISEAAKTRQTKSPKSS